MKHWGFLAASGGAFALAGAHMAARGWQAWVISAVCAVGGGGLAWLASRTWPRRTWARETTTLRVKLLRVRSRWVRCSSVVEDFPFVLDVTREQSLALRPHQGDEVDLEVSYLRDTHGRIRGGHVEDFHLLLDDPQGIAWSHWFAQAGKGWDDVECVMCELGRTCPDHPHAQCRKPCPGTWPECEEATPPSDEGHSRY